MNTSNYFSEVTDPRVTGRCLPLLSDILGTVVKRIKLYNELIANVI